MKRDGLLKKMVLALYIFVMAFSLVACGDLTDSANNEYNDTTESGNTESQVPNESREQGKELSESLIDEMESIDWEENYEKAEEVGEKAAEFLNQFLGGD